jgi:outer membrane lipoprotein-sorting protein
MIFMTNAIRNSFVSSLFRLGRRSSFFIAAMFFVNPGFARSASEIVRIADSRIRGDTNRAELSMTVVRETWSRTLSMKTWMKGFDFSMICITEPARDRGTVFLKRKTEVWNWIPSIERVIKIPPSMMSQSWMGSDFTNDDLVKESSIVHDYTHRITGRETIGDRGCYVIELTPRPEAAVVWGKVILWIDRKDFLQLKAEFYDEEGVLINTMTGSDIREMGGRLIPTRLQMIPADEPGNKTVLQYESIVFDRPIEDAFFSKANMKRLSMKA